MSLRTSRSDFTLRSLSKFATKGGFMNISDATTVRDLATGIPGATRVFENFGIDYCCGGARTLADACREASLPVEDLMRSLEEVGGASQPGAERDWRQESLTALTEYI